MAEIALNIQHVKQPTVLVFGAGVTGASCARYFAARETQVMFADTRELPSGLPAIQAAMPDAELHFGPLPTVLPESIETIVVSPGLQPDKALLAAARAAGVSVVSDIDLFLAEEAGSVLLVTGSNGKSTVTTLLQHLLRAASVRAVAGGNLGVPALDLLNESHDVAVLELSSFQLERSALPHSKVATILNLAVDHLDQHGSFDAYRDAKLRIFANCEIAVVNRAESLISAGDAPTVVSFAADEPAAGHWGIAGEHLVFGSTQIMPVAEVPLTGSHNLLNVLAACAMAHAYGVAAESLRPAVMSFTALPHRMQQVPTRDGVMWINDSKATNEAAAAASVRAVADPLILIAGGDGKGSNFSGLAEALDGRDARVLVFGQDAETLHAALSPVCCVKRVADLDSAVANAREKAKPGTTVLLAPACASLDMFSSYADRGERFANLVAQQLIAGGDE